MASHSFLPRIQSVVYAVFDVRLGPKIVYQVPEGLIGVPSSPGDSLPSHDLPTSAEQHAAQEFPTSRTHPDPTSPSSDIAFEEPTSAFPPSPPASQAAGVSPRTLFQFDDVSKYVIPHSALCGRLVTFATKNCRIIGFPAELKGDYERNYFCYNVCFVFDRAADLSCYEPIVRKISRVLRSCEVGLRALLEHKALTDTSLTTGGIRVLVAPTEKECHVVDIRAALRRFKLLLGDLHSYR